MARKLSGRHEEKAALRRLAYRRRPAVSYPGMALVVFLRGVNVGGHRTFRPSLLARELSEYDVVNVGAANLYRPQATVASKIPGGSASQAAIRSGRDAVRRARPSAPGNGESVWDSALLTGC